MKTTNKPVPFPLLEDPKELAGYQGWSEEAYRDMLAVRSGEMSEDEFYSRYEWEKAVLVLDMTGFTSTTIERGALPALLRIVEAHQVCLPAIEHGGASLIRSFADDLVALFDSPAAALTTAFEIHARMRHFAENHGGLGARCCIGIGYGKLLKIGPNLAQGDEMNRASKLGEDIAKGEQTLVTERVMQALQGSGAFHFTPAEAAALPFPYYHARAAV